MAIRHPIGTSLALHQVKMEKKNALNISGGNLTGAEIHVGDWAGPLALRISEAARLVGISPNQVRGLIDSGQLASFGIHDALNPKRRHLRITYESLREFLRRRVSENEPKVMNTGQ